MHLATNTRQRVLVVEDDPAIGKVLLDVLHAEGYSVHVTPTGQNAIMRLSAPNYPLPDLILLDFNLPDMTGRDVVQVVTARDSRQATPVILLTARSDGATLAHDLGATYYVSKPFDPRAMVELVKASLAAPA